MKTVLHTSDSRGHADHGWLNSYHSFSFANYYNPERMQFGVLRVLNDDEVAPGMGFGTHPHKNMEIISIPLEGDLEHKDSMGNITVIRQGDIQAMSAGTGVEHSEKNKNRDKKVKFLQIWILPNQVNVSPKYDQITLAVNRPKNTFYQIVSPNPEDDGVWIHQNAWMHLGEFDHAQKVEHVLHDNMHGAYVFVLEGTCKVNGQALQKRDALGVWETDTLQITIETGPVNILLIEVPMAN